MIHRIETARRSVRRAFGRSALAARLFAHRHHDPVTPPPSAGDDHRRGLVLVQIDGLSHAELERALARGEMPFLSRLIGREDYRLHRFYSGLPSTTPAVQGELFYGVAGAVPAFAWREREDGALRRMYEPRSAAAIERELAARGEPLLAGGSAYCDIYTGGAAEAHFCAASLGWSDVLRGARPHAWAAVAVLHLPTLVRTLLLAVRESGRAIGEAVLGVARGQPLHQELTFVAARVATVVLLRDLITIGAKIDIARGLPIVHLNFIGYDEQAHRRGPDTRFAHRALAGIDRRIGALWKAAHLAEHRHYDVWLYGDHGQSHVEPYTRRTGRTIEAALVEALRVDDAEAKVLDGQARRDVARVHAPGATPSRRRRGAEPYPRAHFLGGRWPRKLFPGAIGPTRPKGDRERASVVAMGPVGHVLFGARDEQDPAVRERVARWFVESGEVPAVLFVDAEDRVRARTREGVLELPASAADLLGAEHPASTDIVDDLLALARHPRAGDLVLLGWARGREPISFAEENGAHAGASPAETVSFALLPDDALAPEEEEGVMLRPRTLRGAALRALGRAVNAPVPLGVDRSRSASGSANGVTANTTAAICKSGASGATDVTATITAIGTTLSAERPRRLRVMSYNVHGCVGMDGRLAPERIARAIARHSPDVVALQELDVGRARSGGRDQAAVIAAFLEMDHRFHPAIHVEEERYGDAILTRLPVLAHRDGVLPGPRPRRGVEPRGALWVTLDADGVAVQVFNTHLGLTPGERRVQVAELLSARWLGHPACTGPTILCGDLNATPRSAPLKALRTRLADVHRLAPGARRATFPSRLPLLALDHVLVRGVERVERVRVPRTELERLASDHLPLVTDVVLPGTR